MKPRPRSCAWPRYLAVALLFLVLLPAQPAEARRRETPPSLPQLTPPVTAYKLVRALRGTTRQAERVADAIESFEINVCMLTDEHVDGEYLARGGHGSPTAFAYGSTLYVRADSPTILMDLVHEGTHAIDYLAGFPRNKRLMELRAYYYDRQFQQATGVPLQFETLLDMFIFVFITL